MSLLLWYPFTQDGYNRGMVEGNHLSPTINATGILGKCGFANKVTLGTNLDLGSNYSPLNTSSTMTAWIKMNLAECKAVINSVTVNSSAHTPTGCVLGSTSYGGLGFCWMSNNIYNGGNRAELSSINIFGYTRGYNSSGGTAVFTTNSHPITFDKWHHIALVTNKETKKLTFYFDGKFVNEKSYDSLATMNAGQQFGLNRAQIYSSVGPTAKMPIYYNDVRFYDEALSVKEIKELSKALIVHYTFNDPYADPVNNIDSNKNAMQTKLLSGVGGMSTSTGTDISYSFGNFFGFDCFKIRLYKESITSWTGVYLNINPLSYGAVVGDTVVRSCWMYVPSGQTKPGHFTESIEGNSSNKTYKQYDFNNCNTWQRVWMKGTITESSGTNNYLHYFMAMSSGSVDFTCYIRDFQMEINDHSTVYSPRSRNNPYYDESGNGYDANQIDMKYISDTNNGTAAAKFNGSTSCLEVPFIRSDLFKTPYTLSFWVNPDDDDRAIYFGDHQLSGGVNMNFERKSGGKLRYYHGGTLDLEINLTAPVGEWTMITITSDNTTLRFYKNGVEASGTAYTFTPTITKNSGVMRIGRDSRSDYTALAGRMSDFRLYGTALSAADILELYESKAAIDKSNNVFTNEIIEQHEVANMVNLGSWEQGSIQDANGADVNNMNNRIRTKYIPVLPNTSYYFQVATGWNIRGVHFYKKDNTWISYTTIGNTGTRTTPNDCYYVRFVIQNDNPTLNTMLADVTTFGPVMIPGSTATTSGIAADVDVQVTKTYQIKTKDMCENHDAGFFKDGTVSGNRFYEI